jgi:hypothetical protein
MSVFIHPKSRELLNGERLTIGDQIKNNDYFDGPLGWEKCRGIGMYISGAMTDSGMMFVRPVTQAEMRSKIMSRK